MHSTSRSLGVTMVQTMPLAQDILESLLAMPAVLRDASRRISPGDLVRAPADGGFGLLEQACHLRDLEQEGYLVRIERILAEERPRLADFDGAKVAAERNYIAQDFRSAVDDFDRSRSQVVGRLRGLSDQQLNRPAEFGGLGVIDLRRVVDMMLEHDAGHRLEIEQLLKEFRTV
jgi:hypothetical protein